MKTIQIISVDLINYDTFEPLDGAVSFEANFKDFQGESRSHFEFRDQGELDNAINELTASKLEYNLYYRVELESDEELKSYPAVHIAFNFPKHPVIQRRNDLLIVNSKISKKNFHRQFYPHLGIDHLLFSRKGMEFFKESIPNISFREINDSNRKTDYYLLDNIRTLQSPRIYPESCQAELSPLNNQTYNVKNSDGRITFSDDSLEEVKNAIFVKERSFSLNGEEYLSPSTWYLCTGEFAFGFSQYFNLQKEMCSLSIPTLNSNLSLS